MAGKVRRRILIASAGLVLTAGVALGAYTVLGRREVTTSSSEALHYYRVGRENEQKLYMKEAIAAYAEALKRDPEFVMATVRLALLLRESDPERAQSLFRGAKQCVDGVTEREKACIGLFDLMMEGKSSEETEPVLKEYVRRFPKDPEGYLLLGQLHSKSNRMNEAIADIDRLIVLEPNFAWAYNTLGYFWLGQGDHAKAEDYLKRYRFLAPDQANPYDSLGEFYLSVGRYAEAEENLKKALEVKPDFYPSLAHLGTLEIARGNFVAAAERFRSAAEQTDQMSARREWYWSAVVSLALAWRVEDATALVQRIPAVKVEGDERLERREERYQILHRCIFAALVGRTDEAAAELEALKPLLSDLRPDQKTDWDQEQAIARGLIASRQGRLEEAVEALREAIPKSVAPGGFGYFPGRDWLRVALAGNLVRLGRAAEAEEALKPLLSRNPKFQPALDVLAGIRPGAAGAAARPVPAPARS